jgi:predicted dehydrogenase
MKALIIGFGSIGKRHAEVLRHAYPVVSLSIVSRQPLTDFPVFQNLEEVPDLGSFDYFVIASETHQHFRDLDFLIQKVAGKTILVEKPIFDLPHKVSTGSNRILIAYQLRFHPVLQAIHKQLENEWVLYANASVGQYLPTWRPGTDYRQSYSANRHKGGGVLLDLSHEIDFCQWLFGKITVVTGLANKVSDLEIDSDDLATAICRTESGTVVNLSMDYLSRIPFRRILIHTSSKTLLADLIGNTLSVSADDGKPQVFDFPSVEKNHAYLAMHKAAFEHKGGNCCTLNEGLQVLTVVDMIRKSGGPGK